MCIRDSPCVVEMFSPFKCERDHEHGVCTGDELKRTESYTHETCDLLHLCFEHFAQDVTTIFVRSPDAPKCRADPSASAESSSGGEEGASSGAKTPGGRVSPDAGPQAERVNSDAGSVSPDAYIHGEICSSDASTPTHVRALRSAVVD